MADDSLVQMPHALSDQNFNVSIRPSYVDIQDLFFLFYYLLFLLCFFYECFSYDEMWIKAQKSYAAVKEWVTMSLLSIEFGTMK